MTATAHHRPAGYSGAAAFYVERGWHPFPLPAGAKSPPPDGVTGTNGTNPTPDQIDRWVQLCDGANIGIRMPDTVVGIDVDHYDGKHGAATLAALEAQYGKLPPTWTSTSRGDGPSGIRFYRIPAGVIFPGQFGPDIEAIQHHHRYAVVAPSTHPKTGQRYRWHTTAGHQATHPPNTNELADLPPAWVDGLRWQIAAPQPHPTGGARLLDDDSIADRIRDDNDWHDTLTGDGWRIVRNDPGTTSSWTRPGKDPRHGISAVLHEPDGPLVVFSTSVPELQQAWALNPAGTGWSFSMFGYLAATRYAGDRSECARDHRKITNQLDAKLHTIRTATVAAAVLSGIPPAAIAATTSHLVDWPTFWAEDRTDEDFIAYPLVPRGRAVAVYAPAKAGKSSVVLALVAALATGRPLFGNTRAPAVDVLYLDYEMTEADLMERLVELGYDETENLTRLHYALMPSMPPLDTRAGAEALNRLAEQVGAELVVVDTFGRAVEGDENEADTSRAFYRHTGMMLKAAGRAVIRTDHAGKDLTKGQRGSSAKNDDVDVVWQMRRTDSGVALTRTHSRVSWVPVEVELSRLVDVDLGQVAWSITTGAPSFREGTTACVDALVALGLDDTVGERPSWDAVKMAGLSFPRSVVRAAVKARHDVAAGRLHLTQISAKFGQSGAPAHPNPDRASAPPRRTTARNEETAGHTPGAPSGAPRRTPPGPEGGAAVSIDTAHPGRTNTNPNFEGLIEPI